MFGTFLSVCFALAATAPSAGEPVVVVTELAPFNESCLIEQNYTLLVIEAKHTELLGWTVIKNISELRSRGYQVELLLYASPNLSVDRQVQELFAKVPASSFDRAWLTVGYSFSTRSPLPSCSFVQSFLRAVLSRGKQIGVMSDSETWQTVFGDVFGCADVAFVPMWTGDPGCPDIYGGWNKVSRAFDKANTPLCKTYYRLARELG